MFCWEADLRDSKSWESYNLKTNALVWVEAAIKFKLWCAITCCLWGQATLKFFCKGYLTFLLFDYDWDSVLKVDLIGFGELIQYCIRKAIKLSN